MNHLLFAVLKSSANNAQNVTISIMIFAVIYRGV